MSESDDSNDEATPFDLAEPTMTHRIPKMRHLGYLAVLMLAGCAALTPGRNPLSQGQTLLNSAKEMRQSATVPPAVPRELDKHVLPPYIVEPGDVLLVQIADLESTEWDPLESTCRHASLSIL